MAALELRRLTQHVMAVFCIRLVTQRNRFGSIVPIIKLYIALLQNLACMCVIHENIIFDHVR
jgi:predicted RND superfamily exporter protein